MTETLKLDGDGPGGRRIRRLNRLPVLVAILPVVVFLAVIFYGLSSRGLHFGGSDDIEATSGASASNYADELTQGIPNAIIGEPKSQPFCPRPTHPSLPLLRRPRPSSCRVRRSKAMPIGGRGSNGKNSSRLRMGCAATMDHEQSRSQFNRRSRRFHIPIIAASPNSLLAEMHLRARPIRATSEIVGEALEDA